MKIRRYNKNDFPKILDIYAKSKLDELRFEKNKFELLPLEYDEKRLNELKESDIYVYDNNGVVGYTALYDQEIRALFVHPNNRGKGIGKNLLEYLLSKLKEPASLYVTKSNIHAINLYTKYGFKVVKEFKTTYNGNNVLVNKMVQIKTNG